MNQWDAQSASSSPAPPVGREDAFAALNRSFEEYQEDGAEEKYIWLLHGDAGTGKQELVDFFLRWGPVEKHAIQRIDCLASEQDIPLMPWEHLLLNLWDMASSNDILLPIPVIAHLETAFALSDPRRQATVPNRMTRHLNAELESAVDALLEALEKVRPLLLVLENIHWMDDESLFLLDSLLHRSRRTAILMTCRDYSGGIFRDALHRITESDLVHTIKLAPLTEDQVHTLLTRELGAEEAGILTESFHRNTCGDLRLLRKLIRARKETAGQPDRPAETILFGSLQGLSEQSLRAARILSVYPGDMMSSLFLEMFGGGENQLTLAVSELLRAGIIEEIHADSKENCYRLTHPRLREMIYERMSVFERRPLHRQIAEMMAENAKENGGSLLEISIQYELSGDHRRSLEYRIHELSRLTSLAFVPFLAEAAEEPIAVDPSDILAQCTKCHRDLNHTFTEPEDEEKLLLLECDLLEIRGITEICKGDIAQGITSLGNISGFSQNRNELRQLRLCSLLGDLAIRQQEVTKAERYLATGMRILERKRNEFYLAVFRRLQGCCFMLRRSYEKAGYYLIEAIEALETMPAHLGSHLQLAQAYSDYGRLSRYQNKYAKACSFFKKSLALLDGKNLSFSVWIYVHYGRTVYALEDHLTAKSLFDKACRIAEQTGELLGRTAAESYAAIYAARSEDREAAARHLKNAASLVEKASAPLETSIFNFARMSIRRMLDRRQLDSEILHKILPENATEYARLGIMGIGDVPDVYEVEEMQAILRTNIVQKDSYKASDLYSKNKWFMTE